MNGVNEHAIPPQFIWKPDYDSLLEQISMSDYIETDWDVLRNVLKYKLDKNITDYLENPPAPLPPPPPVSADPMMSSPGSISTVSSRIHTTTGGLRLPPFPRREESVVVRNEYNPYGRQKSELSKEEAREQRDEIFELLHNFDEQPPFTIQRLCELTLRPRGFYRSIGKYLRAFERALLVTSTIDAFPLIIPEGPQHTSLSEGIFSPMETLREATTPLFSPIPFLHEDARRSRSRSPPVSPLVLAQKGGVAVDPLSADLDVVAVPSDSIPEGVIDGPVIGMVDELDDPGPGHLSEHPTALTSTTTSGPTFIQGRPLYGSLQERFVGSQDPDAMILDDQEADKENKKQ